jgi:hypothetical protein
MRRWVALDCRQPALELAYEGRLLRQGHLEQVRHLLDRRGEVDGLEREASLPGIGEHLLGQLGGSRSRRDHLEHSPLADDPAELLIGELSRLLRGLPKLNHLQLSAARAREWSARLYPSTIGSIAIATKSSAR